jgi:flagellar FliJ protein
LSTTTTLDLLLEQAERERDAARAALQRAELGRRQAEGQAEQLVSYRRQSLQRWGAQPGRTGDAAMLHCLHAFMQRLDQASAQQQRQCDLSARQVDQARQALQRTELRVAAVAKLQQRRRKAAAAQNDRREQKQLDEAAQRVAWASRADASPH